MRLRCSSRGWFLSLCRSFPYFDLLTRKVYGFLLIVEFVGGFLSSVKQHVLLAHFDAVFGTHRPSHRVVLFADYIFAGEKFGTPLNLANLARRVIESKIEERGVPCLGWHAFRRGLASNLSILGVHPRVIQAVLRHSDVRTTMQYYVQELDGQTRAALERLGEVLVPLGISPGTHAGTQVKRKKPRTSSK